MVGLDLLVHLFDQSGGIAGRIVVHDFFGEQGDDLGDGFFCGGTVFESRDELFSNETNEIKMKTTDKN